MIDEIRQANRTILKTDGVREHYGEGDTKDIIWVILEADKHIRGDTKDFARSFAGSNLKSKLKRIWFFVHRSIKYVADTPGHEKIKSPAQTWQDGYADCKSMSLFVASILKNLNIPYAYRFVGYNKNLNVSHVYVVAKPTGQKEIIIDTVHHKFNEEVPFAFKKDYNMTQISYIHGIQATDQSGSDLEALKNIPNGTVEPRFIDYGLMTDGELSLNLMDQQLEMVQAAFGDPNGAYAQGRKMIKGYLDAGLHNPNIAGIHGPVPQEIEHVAKLINEARTETRPAAGVFTKGPAKRSTASNSIHQIGNSHRNGTCEKEDGGRWVFSEFDRDTDEEIYVYRARNPQEYKECQVREHWSVTLNKHLEGSAPHLLYHFIDNKEVVPQVVASKRQDHKLVVSRLRTITGLSQKNMDIWLTNGIMRTTSNRRRLGLRQPKEVINLLKLAPVDDKIGVVAVATVATIKAIEIVVGILISIFSAAIGAIVLLKQQPSVASQLRDITGLETPAFGPESPDFNNACYDAKTFERIDCSDRSGGLKKNEKLPPKKGEEASVPWLLISAAVGTYLLADGKKIFK